MRLKLTLEYDGAGFRGWAAQPGLRTVEREVRAALDGTFGRWSGLAVAGRTDTGVHARGQVVSVDADGGPPVARAAAALNTRLPEDVAVVAAEPAPPDFHARFSARARTYRYRVFTRRVRSPLERKRSWWYPRPIDDAALASSAAAVVGEHDFRAFTPTETQHEVFVRAVESAAWHRRGDVLEFEITAESFLRHMVRTLVGTMLESSPERVEGLVGGRERSEAGATAPPHGLYLEAVRY